MTGILVRLTLLGSKDFTHQLTNRCICTFPSPELRIRQAEEGGMFAIPLPMKLPKSLKYEPSLKPFEL